MGRGSYQDQALLFSVPGNDPLSIRGEGAVQYSLSVKVEFGTHSRHLPFKGIGPLRRGPVVKRLQNRGQFRSQRRVNGHPQDVTGR
jgi:hypothetical protein